jgi:hypothetical protein
VSILVGVVVVVLFVAVALLVAWPLLYGPAPESVEAPRVADEQRRQVEEDLDRTLAAIKEIEFDRAAGHLSDEDFRALDADERARAVELLRRRDGLAAQGRAMQEEQPS